MVLVTNYGRKKWKVNLTYAIGWLNPLTTTSRYRLKMGVIT